MNIHATSLTGTGTVYLTKVDKDTVTMSPSKSEAMAVQPEQAPQLARLVRLTFPDAVVDTGTGSDLPSFGELAVQTPVRL